MKNFVRFIALALVLFTFLNIFAFSYTKNELSCDLLEFPEIVYSSSINPDDLCCRLYKDETTLNSINYLTEAGNKVEYVFPYAIKYVENGKIKDKSTRIVNDSSPKYAYKNIDNDIQIQFGKSIDRGINLQNNDYIINIKPLNTNHATPLIEENPTKVVYKNVFNDYSDIEYTLGFDGIKEDIIIYNKPNTYTYQFVVDYSDNLNLCQKDGIIGFYDNDKKIALISDVIIIDNKNNTYMGNVNITYYNNQCILDICFDCVMDIDESYYPIIVDPSIHYVYNDPSSINIIDGTVTKCLNQYSSNFTSSTMSLGRTGTSTYNKIIINFANIMNYLNCEDSSSYRANKWYYNYNFYLSPVTQTYSFGGNFTYNCSSWTQNTSSSTLYNNIASNILFSFNVPVMPTTVPAQLNLNTLYSSYWKKGDGVNNAIDREIYGISLSATDNYMSFWSTECSNSNFRPYFAFYYKEYSWYAQNYVTSSAWYNASLSNYNFAVPCSCDTPKYGLFAVMEQCGCSIFAFTNVLRNLNATTTSQHYNLATATYGYLDANPINCVMSNNKFPSISGTTINNTNDPTAFIDDLYNNYGYYKTCIDVGNYSEASKITELKTALDNHPEGIVAKFNYGSKQHFITIVKYCFNDFYVADSIIDGALNSEYNSIFEEGNFLQHKIENFKNSHTYKTYRPSTSTTMFDSLTQIYYLHQ